MSDSRIKFGNFNLQYNDPHDLAAIIESYVLNVYRIQKIKKGGIVVDVGAGIGEFAVIASKIVGNEGKVIAIEPSPEDFKTLQYNIKKNKCGNVIPINSAVSDKKEKLSLSFKGKNFESKADTLQNIIENLKVPVNSIHYMKMDIEGAERFVIPLSIDIIKNFDYLAIQIHDGFSSELIPYMSSQGFEFKRVERNEYILNAFKKVVLHPTDAYRLWKAFKSTGENPGLAKISSGIDISKSDELVVGLFFKPNITA
ncbi:FkbM family methyltransferase [Cuniculiplasma divulgatum]|uniref:SAM-dependent methyltransferase n=1 Tax=Cuniculiplasma divulgatum TaxID=1673428 RepID=A0A1N5UJL6_9ARCH|nr:FkbM family methyltransferase [Cuniculiplasma divulgatum]SIM60796.1 SAM-dependent methyltransferase [Cuniculiplasma divulgatum]SJK84838.1 SAM-dependent methyltransferase [Cuniculiplasma divulgatum]